jgi:CheY-like chemotaxis protein
MSRVLVIDDDASFVETCAMLLRYEGHDVSGAGSVSAALQSLAVRSPEAMLLDWQLPDGTGLDVLRWLDLRNVRVPTALITGFWSDDHFDAALTSAKRFGVAACLRRGIDLAAPSEVVRRILGPLQDVHSSVLRGDLTACESLSARLLERIVPRLRARSRFVSVDMATDAVTDAILKHLANPAAFNPVRHASIEHFIWVIARRNLSNALRTARRDLVRDSEYAALLRIGTAEFHGDQHVERRQIIEKALRQEPDPHTRIALREWLFGDHSSSPWMKVGALVALWA